MKYRKLLIITFIGFLFPFVVNADNISLKCPTEVDANTEFSCDIYGNSSDGVFDIASNISLTNFSFVTFEAVSGLNGQAKYEESTNKYKIGLYGLELLTGDFKIGTLRIKGSSKYQSGRVMLTGTNFTKDSAITSVANCEETISIKNSSTDVKNNVVSKQEGSQNNTSNNNSKNVSDIENEPNDVVDDNNTTVEEYDIDFTKGAYLLDLKIAGHDIDFRSDIYQYDIEIWNEKKLKITPVVSSKDVTYTIVGNENLKDGSIVSIEVIYKNEQIQNYYINIIKKEKKSNLIFIFVGIIIVLILVNAIRMFIVWKKSK